jgi:hypothetical protein
MPKKIQRGPYEKEIKKLLGLPWYVNILSLGTYEKRYFSVKEGLKTYLYYRVHYYDPIKKLIYRKHIKEKDLKRKTKVLALWRLEQKYRRGEVEGAGDKHILEIIGAL